MTPADFIAAFPKFEQVDTVDIQRWIDRSDPAFDVDVWGNWLTEGLGNYVAHGLCEEGVRGVPIKAIGPGDAQGAGAWRLEVALFDADPMASTVYGRKYLRLRDGIVGRGAVVV